MTRILLCFIFILCSTIVYAQYSESQIIDSYNRKIAGLQSNLNEYRQKLADCENRLRQASTTINSLTGSSEYDDLVREKEWYIGNIKSLEDQITSARNQCNSEIENLKQKKKAEEELKRQLAAKQKREQARKLKEEAEAEREAQKQAEREAERARKQAEWEEELARREAARAEEQRRRDAYGEQVKRERYEKDMSNVYDPFAARVERNEAEAQAMADLIAPENRRNQFVGNRHTSETRVYSSTNAKPVVASSYKFEIGKIKVKENMQSDVDAFLLQQLQSQGAISNTQFCSIMTEKVCGYFGVDKRQFFNKTLSYDVIAEISSSLDSYASLANKRLNYFCDKTSKLLKQSANTGEMDWYSLKSVYNSHQLVSALNIISTQNNKKLPGQLAEDEKYLYYQMSETGKLARINKSNGIISIIQTDLRNCFVKSLIYTMQMEIYRQSISPLMVYNNVYKHNSHFRHDYRLDKTGAASETVEKKNESTHKYKIKAPRLKFSGDEIDIVNEYSDKRQFAFDEKISWSIYGEVSFFKGLFSIKKSIGNEENSVSIGADINYVGGKVTSKKTDEEEQSSSYSIFGKFKHAKANLEWGDSSLTVSPTWKDIFTFDLKWSNWDFNEFGGKIFGKGLKGFYSPSEGDYSYGFSYAPTRKLRRALPWPSRKLFVDGEVAYNREVQQDEYGTKVSSQTDLSISGNATLSHLPLGIGLGGGADTQYQNEYRETVYENKVVSYIDELPLGIQKMILAALLEDCREKFSAENFENLQRLIMGSLRETNGTNGPLFPAAEFEAIERCF